MYVTKPLSEAYKNKSHDAFSRPNREEPTFGCLFLQDDQEEERSCCFGCRDFNITTLPFPQNTFLITYPAGDEYSYILFFVPVINAPISSNRYYIMRKYHGDALRCATLEDRQSSCFCCTTIPDEDPQPLDPEDIYQQFEISYSKSCKGYFTATSVAPDGIVPQILGINFEVKYKRVLPSLGEAKGLDFAIRDHLPKMDFPLSCIHSEAVVVGKWWCPFMFIKEATMKEQIKRSLFYEMTLERRWECVFTCRNSHGVDGKIVDVDVVIANGGIRVLGKEAARFEEDLVDGVVWFKGVSVSGDELPSVGLSSVIVERMISEEERVGWVRSGDGKEVRVKRKEAYEGDGLWERFGCFVLVERFVVKRMDGMLVLE